jgi:hypothetical protein
VGYSLCTGKSVEERRKEGQGEAKVVGVRHVREWSTEIHPKVLQIRDFLLPFIFAMSPCLIRV